MSNFTSRLNTQMDAFRHKRRIKTAIRALAPTEFVHYPEPTTPGDYARGLRLLNGEIFQDNQIHNLEGSIWDYNYPSQLQFDRFQAFDWMDDLAAVKTNESARRMRQWTQEWFERYGHGEGSGWRPDLLGWRVIRLITHAITLLGQSSAVHSERYFEALGIQVGYLREVAESAEDGLPRVVCYVAWLFAALSLDRFHDDVEDVVDYINTECAELVEGNEIYLHSRNPEELSQIFCLLVWADRVLEEESLHAGKYHDQAMDVIGRALRTLRFGDHLLLPANGGGTGDAQEIERALSYAQIQGSMHDQNVLGFRNIRASHLNIFLDCAPPPSGKSYNHTHASTLGLWVAERSQILIAAGGAASQQPLVTQVEQQETAAHSVLVLADQSSSELELQKDARAQYTTGATIDTPAQVFDFALNEDHQSINWQASHDGYLERFGYVHQRKMVFDRDGLYFGGLDVLSAQTPQDEKKVQSVLGRRNNAGIPVDIFFHLGPRIEPSLDNNAEMVSFRSDIGHLWIFRQEGGRIDIVDNPYFYADRLTPSPAKSIVIRTRLMDVSGYVSWSLQAYPDL